MNADPAALPSRPSPGAAGARLGELYAEHARMVLGICRLMLRDPSEAEDATQQVFLSAYRSLLAGTEVEKAGAWLGTIARNESLMRIQVRMRSPLATGDMDTRVSPGVEEQAQNRSDAADLYTELAALPLKQREAVVLRDLYGLRYDEVATALGTSRPAVEALLFRGRRRLRRRLGPSLAAGVLVVPLALQESLAYAVPGFAAAAGPGAAVGVAAATPLLVKLAAGSAAAVLAGSAGVAVQGKIHDRPEQRVQTKKPARVTEERVSVRAIHLPPLAATQAQQFSDLVAPQLAAAAGKVTRADEADDDDAQRESHEKTSQADEDGADEDTHGPDRSGSGSGERDADADEAEQEQHEPEEQRELEEAEKRESGDDNDSDSSGSDSSDSNDESDTSGED